MLKGYGSDYYCGSSVHPFHLPGPAVQRCQPGVFPGELIFCAAFWVLSERKSGAALQRSKAQFGVAPHLCTNFRVSRMPNRTTALPWQWLTAKSTVYHLTGLQIISHRYTQPIIAVFLQHGTFRRALNLCFRPVRHLTLFTRHRGNAMTSVQP